MFGWMCVKREFQVKALDFRIKLGKSEYYFLMGRVRERKRTVELKSKNEQVFLNLTKLSSSVIKLSNSDQMVTHWK